MFFKIKKATPLKKLMEAYCEKQGKSPNALRFLFDGVRINPTDTPEKASPNQHLFPASVTGCSLFYF